MRAQILFLILLAGLAVLTIRNRDQIQTTIARVTSRGIRNNNPGNIRSTDTAWRGEVPATLKRDTEFEEFISPLFGVRAMARILKKGETAGRDTVREIITRWAPPSENDTAAYIRSVSRRADLGPDEPINFDEKLPDLLDAIIVHENGSNPYADQLLFEAIAAA